MQRTRVLRLVDLADFLESSGTNASSLPELDRLMVDEVGAERIDVVSLDEIHHRLLRRITRRRPPMTNIHYDVPDLRAAAPRRSRAQGAIAITRPRGTRDMRGFHAFDAQSTGYVVIVSV